jgi:hypothetical protein
LILRQIIQLFLGVTFWVLPEGQEFESRPARLPPCLSLKFLPVTESIVYSDVANG